MTHERFARSGSYSLTLLMASCVPSLRLLCYGHIRPMEEQSLTAHLFRQRRQHQVIRRLPGSGSVTILASIARLCVQLKTVQIIFLARIRRQQEPIHSRAGKLGGFFALAAFSAAVPVASLVSEPLRATASEALRQAGIVPPQQIVQRLASPTVRSSAMTPPDARKRNASVPYTHALSPSAQPFLFTGASLDQQRAVDCLAIAAMAEAGSSDPGQRAVIQVVLNRVRHPAFANTVCGTVFTGSNRATGCQFTFTCDGALQRRYSGTAWAQARRRAKEALHGRVYTSVGLATHYHADWVYPYWSVTLDKIARVETHLFFRWPGARGTQEAMSVRHEGHEPAIAALSMLGSHSAAGTKATVLASARDVESMTSSLSGASKVVVAHPGGRAFFVHLAGSQSTGDAVSLARELCPSSAGNCRALAWTERAVIPAAYPVPAPSRARLTFSYVREAGREIVLYDCKHFDGVARERCIPPAPGARSTNIDGDQAAAAASTQAGEAAAPAPASATGAMAVRMDESA